MILDISTWWTTMETFEKIYWILAFPTTLLFIILIIMTFVGIDADHDMDMDHDGSIDADHGIGFQFFSYKNLLGFFTIFAWSGIACIDSGLNVFPTIVISLFSGLLMMLIMASIFYFISKLSESGNLNINNAIGKVGTAYLPIPGQRKGMGKVQIKIQGLKTLDAMTDDEKDIKTGLIVDCIDVLNDEILLVRRSKT